MVQISITDFTENSNGEVRKNNTVAKEEKRVMTAHMALINFLKGLIGPGCMSLPMAFRQSGLWTGFALVFFIGVLTCLCMLKIVRCSQVLTSRNPKIKTLNYAEMAQESFRQSFPCLRHYENIARRFVNLCIASLIIGICSVHYVFTVDHIMEIVNHIWPEVHISKLSYLVMLIIPFLILSFVRNLVLMSYVSMAGNVFMLFSTVIIFYHLFSSEHVTDKVPWFTNLHGLILTTPAIIYAFGGQVLILPLENKMKHPSEMLGLTGVLSTGMALVTILYAGCGFFGYITYGNDVKASITLNMDDS
ncbi:unnamed protein product [Nippostrongylus brasiliensis]|uniref:Aa_trans domain-containing protein n=2 Tax=Nippostrongylus brasiliensis TaxID=27835 RepID=A0A158R0Y9_NIPBR|nr:unnamed protein product [Nippostrongylus brasiliensis]